MQSVQFFVLPAGSNYALATNYGRMVCMGNSSEQEHTLIRLSLVCPSRHSPGFSFYPVSHSSVKSPVDASFQNATMLNLPSSLAMFS
jgi:hypothetical protein